MRFLRVLGWLTVVITFSLTLVILASPTSYEIAGINTRVSVAARSSGGSVVAIPPLGEIRARTHAAPVGLNIEIEGVNQTVITKTLNNSRSSADYFRVVERDARKNARGFFFKLLLLAALGGLAGCLLLTRKRLPVIGAPLISIAVTGVLLLVVYAQFNVTAFTQPQISGPLASIPFLATSIEQQTNPIKALREDITIAAKNLKDFSAKIENWQPVELDKGAIRVLAVSDLHNNPTGFSLVERVSRDFKVDFIIDTGDITDLGTPLEASQLSQLNNLTVPYLYVPGNHDTPAIVQELAGLSRVEVLDHRQVQEKGLAVYGAADPMAASAQVEPLSDKDMANWSLKLERDFKALSTKPVILAVHDKRMAERLVGSVPVIINGHTHQAAIEQVDGTVLVNPGSTGAGGLRALQKEEPSAQIYTLSLIYFDGKSKQVVAIDSLQVTGLSGEFSLMRKLIRKP